MSLSVKVFTGLTYEVKKEMAEWLQNHPNIKIERLNLTCSLGYTGILVLLLYHPCRAYDEPLQVEFFVGSVVQIEERMITWLNYRSKIKLVESPQSANLPNSSEFVVMLLYVQPEPEIC